MVNLSAVLTHSKPLHLNHVFEILCKILARDSRFEMEILESKF